MNHLLNFLASNDSHYLISSIFIVTIASILMMFDSVKNLGVGILTTAG